MEDLASTGVEEKKKIRKLTYKEKAFVKEFVGGKDKLNGTAAAMKVYDVKSRDSAHAIASENLSKLPIKLSIEQLLKASGYNPQDSIKRIIVNAEAGAGVKATATDSLKADETLLKLSGYTIDRKASLNLYGNLDNIDPEQGFQFANRYAKLKGKRQR